MPTSKHRRKNGKNKVTARSRKTHLRHLHKVHAAKRRDRVYRQIREMQAAMNSDGVQEAFDEALAEETE